MITATSPVIAMTDEQRRIVEWDEGPAVVIAGAGTGKTRVIVERVRHLLDTHDDLLPEQLLVLTYNVKAAAELATRIEHAVGPATAARILEAVVGASRPRGKQIGRQAGSITSARQSGGAVRGSGSGG